MNRNKKIISSILTFLMVFSMVMISPRNTEAAVPVPLAYSIPITAYASDDDTTTWKFLFVVPMNFHVDDRTGEALTEEDVQLFLDYVVPNFEAAMYEYSMHYMRIESTVVTIDDMEGSVYEGSDLPADSDVKRELDAGNYQCVSGTMYDLKEYDHIASCFAPHCTQEGANSTYYEWESLGGSRFLDYFSSYSTSLLFEGMHLSESDRAAKSRGFRNTDGTMHVGYCASLLIREFLRGLQYFTQYSFPDEQKKQLPDIEGFGIYYDEPLNEDTDICNTLYRDFLRGNVPTSAGSGNTFGMQRDDYKNRQSMLNPGQCSNVTVDSVGTLNYVMMANYFNSNDNDMHITLTDNIDAAGKDLFWFCNFGGTLDGGGYAIKGANLGSVGLIQELNGTVKNLLLIDARMTNRVDSYRGGICNINHGSILNCGVTGNIIGADYVGGIAGWNASDGIIESCFNAADINISGGRHFAGIAGYNQGRVFNCYNSGKIVSKENYTTYGITEKGNPENCFSLKGCSEYVSYNSCEGMVTSAELASDEMTERLNNCFVMGNSYPTILNAKAHFEQCRHTEVVDEAEPGTCTEPAKSRGTHCSDCGKILVPQKITAPKGHKHTSKFVWDSNFHCVFSLECSACGEQVFSENSKVTVAKTDATYFAPGKITYIAVSNYEGTSYTGKTYSSIPRKTLSTPKIKSVTNTALGISVNWNPVPDATGYYLYRDGWLIYSSFSGSTGYVDKRVSPLLKYNYKVVAITQNGNSFAQSAASPTVSIVRMNTNSIRSVTNVATKKAVVTWNTVSGAAGYQIRYFLGSSYKTITLAGGSRKSYTLTNLLKNKKYKVYVRSYRKVGGKTYYSGWSAAKTILIKK